MDYYREFEAEDDAHNYARSLHGYEHHCAVLKSSGEVDRQCFLKTFRRSITGSPILFDWNGYF